MKFSSLIKSASSLASNLSGGSRAVGNAASKPSSIASLLRISKKITKGAPGTSIGKKIASKASKPAAAIAATSVALIVANKVYKDMKEDELKCNAACLPEGWEAYAYAEDDALKEELEKKLEFHTEGNPVCTAEFETKTCGDYCVQECQKIAESKNIVTSVGSKLAGILPFGSDMLSGVYKGVVWIGVFIFIIIVVVVLMWLWKMYSGMSRTTSYNNVPPAYNNNAVNYRRIRAEKKHNNIEPNTIKANTAPERVIKSINNNVGQRSEVSKKN